MKKMLQPSEVFSRVFHLYAIFSSSFFFGFLFATPTSGKRGFDVRHKEFFFFFFISVPGTEDLYAADPSRHQPRRQQGHPLPSRGAVHTHLQQSHLHTRFGSKHLPKSLLNFLREINIKKILKYFDILPGSPILLYIRVFCFKKRNPAQMLKSLIYIFQT